MSLRPHGSAGVSRGSCGRCTETKTLYMSLNLIFIEVIYNCGAGEVVFFAASGLVLFLPTPREISQNKT